MENCQLKHLSIEPCVLANAHNISPLEAEAPKFKDSLSNIIKPSI